METNLGTLPIGDDAPRLLNAVIEVPVGSRNKYEYEPDLGVIMRDRVLPGAVRYPTDYGFVPSTLTDRGDALDVVVAAYDPAFPGCVVRARPIGALHITDSKGEEHNAGRPRRRPALRPDRRPGGPAEGEPARDRAVLRGLQAPGGRRGGADRRLGGLK